MRWLLLCIGLSACRLHFDATDRSDGSIDGPGAPDAIDALPTCARAAPVPPSAAISGTLVAASGDDIGSCGGAGVAEVVFSIDVPNGSTGLVVGVDGPPVLDALMYVRTTCDDPSAELVCDLDSGTGEGAADYIHSPAPGSYYVFVDGQNGITGDFSGTIQVLLPEGATCSTLTPRDRCGPELACIAGTCQPAGCTIAEILSGASSYQRTVVTTGAPDDHAGTCGNGGDGGVRAPEVVYRLDLPSAVSNVHVSTVSAATDFDTLIYVRASCTDQEIACNDDSATTSSRESDLDTGALSAGSYFIFIDGFAMRSGTAGVTVTVTP